MFSRALAVVACGALTVAGAGPVAAKDLAPTPSGLSARLALNPQAKLKPAKSTVEVGTALPVAIRVAKPRPKRFPALVQVKDKGSWKSVKRIRVAKGKARTSLTFDRPGTAKLRMRAAKQRFVSPVASVKVLAEGDKTVPKDTKQLAPASLSVATTMSRAQVTWNIPEPDKAPESVTLEYRQGDAAQWTSLPQFPERSTATVLGLKPGTRVQFRITYTRDAMSSTSDPVAATTAPAEKTVYSAGDIGICGGKQAEVAALVPDGATFIAPGDIAQRLGEPAEYTDCFAPHYQRIMDSFFPVPGNHDYYKNSTNIRGKAYFDFFGPRVGVLGASWYAIDVGSWKFLMLDSNCDIKAVGGCTTESPQYKWAQQQLQNSGNKCLAMVWHHPRWVTGEWIDGESTWMAPYYQLAVDHGADLLLTGHVHRYERFPRMLPDGTPSQWGMRQFVVGTGGMYLGLTSQTLPTMEKRVDKHGLLELTLGPDGYDWSFLTVDGSEGDYGSDTC